MWDQSGDWAGKQKEKGLWQSHERVGLWRPHVESLQVAGDRTNMRTVNQEGLTVNYMPVLQRAERLPRKTGIGMGASLKVTHRENEDTDKTAEAKEERKWAPERERLVRSLRLAPEEKPTKLCWHSLKAWTQWGRKGPVLTRAHPTGHWPMTRWKRHVLTCINIHKNYVSIYRWDNLE